MAKISLNEWLKEDFENLKNEYINEDKAIYTAMFNKYIPCDIRAKLVNNEYESYDFTSTEEYFLDFNLGVSIHVELYCQVTPYFYALFNLEEYSNILRNDERFRYFTKLCFYIINHVTPKF